MEHNFSFPPQTLYYPTSLFLSLTHTRCVQSIAQGNEIVKHSNEQRMPSLIKPAMVSYVTITTEKICPSLCLSREIDSPMKRQARELSST